MSETVKHTSFVPTEAGDESPEAQRNTAPERSVEDRLADLLAEVEGKETALQASYGDLTAQATEVKTKLDRETTVKTVLREALEKLKPQSPAEPEPAPAPEHPEGPQAAPKAKRGGKKKGW